jgi:anti-sigma B factor antagonist
MSCEVEKRKDRVRIRGEMTIYNAVGLKDDLFNALRGLTDRCAIDLSKVSEFDSTGLQILLMVQRACASGGVIFSLLDPSSIVRETLELLRMSKFCIEVSERKKT